MASILVRIQASLVLFFPSIYVIDSESQISLVVKRLPCK